MIPMPIKSIVKRPFPPQSPYNFTWENPRQLLIRFKRTHDTDGDLVIDEVRNDAPLGLCNVESWFVSAVDGEPCNKNGKQLIQDRMKRNEEPITLTFISPQTTSRNDEIVSAKHTTSFKSQLQKKIVSVLTESKH